MAKSVQSGKICVIIQQKSAKTIKRKIIWFHQVHVTLYVARDAMIAAKATRLFKLQTRQSFYCLHRSY